MFSQDVADMDKAVFPFIDIDEGRLDIKEDIRDPAAVDIPCHLARFFPVENEICEVVRALGRRNGSLSIRC